MVIPGNFCQKGWPSLDEGYPLPDSQRYTDKNFQMTFVLVSVLCLTGIVFSMTGCSGGAEKGVSLVKKGILYDMYLTYVGDDIHATCIMYVKCTIFCNHIIV